jgi:hypothetical protein
MRCDEAEVAFSCCLHLLYWPHLSEHFIMPEPKSRVITRYDAKVFPNLMVGVPGFPLNLQVRIRHNFKGTAAQA